MGKYCITLNLLSTAISTCDAHIAAFMALARCISSCAYFHICVRGEILSSRAQRIITFCLIRALLTVEIKRGKLNSVFRRVMKNCCPRVSITEVDVQITFTNSITFRTTVIHETVNGMKCDINPVNRYSSSPLKTGDGRSI